MQQTFGKMRREFCAWLFNRFSQFQLLIWFRWRGIKYNLTQCWHKDLLMGLASHQDLLTHTVRLQKTSLPGSTNWKAIRTPRTISFHPGLQSPGPCLLLGPGGFPHSAHPFPPQMQFGCTKLHFILGIRRAEQDMKVSHAGGCHREKVRTLSRDKGGC